MNDEPEFLFQTRGLKKVYSQGGKDLTVLHDVDLAIRPGEVVALVGPSGAGKSTFLQMIGLLDQPTSGQIIMHGYDITSATDKERTQLRREFIGFIYQFHYLQPEFSALENVILPQLIAGRDYRISRNRAEKILERLGLAERLHHRPARLSGGEQQRVAFARALANKPSLLLADEPTGNLDPETSDIVFNEMLELARNTGIGAIVATHNLDLAQRMDRILLLQNGTIT